MKTQRPSYYLIAAAAGAILLAGLWWGLAPERAPRPLPSESNHLRPESAGSPGNPKSVAPDATPADSQSDVRVKRIRELLATLEPVLPGETESKTALDLLHWWEEIDPVAAITYAHSHPASHGRAELPVELFTLWLDAKHDAAIAWATALPHGDLRAQLLPAVISVVAETRPQDALAMASELDGENRRLALSSLFAEWTSADPERAAAEAQRLPTTDEQSLALRQVIGKWADRDLPASIAWVKRLPPAGDPGSLDIQVGPLEILLEKWTSQAPMDAASYLVSLPEGARRIQMLSTAAGQWAEQNPRDALAWASGLSSEADRNVAIRGVLAGAAQSDAAAAANLALTLPAGIEQEKGMELIIDQWSARAPENLMRWATTQVSDTARREALPSIVKAWAGADLPTLGDWLNALPAGDARDTCCAALVRHLAPTQPDVARQWAATIGDLSLRQKEMNEIARTDNRR